MTPNQTPAPRHAQPHSRPGRWVRLLPALTLAAVLTITASSEYELARTVLAQPPAIAWALPVAIDTYVLTAFRFGRDVRPALAVMAGALTAAMGAHLTTALQPGHALPVTVEAPAATAIMTVLVVVAWRVHVLIEHATLSSAPEPADAGGATSGRVPTQPELPPAAVASAVTPASLGGAASAPAIESAPAAAIAASATSAPNVPAPTSALALAGALTSQPSAPAEFAGAAAVAARAAAAPARASTLTATPSDAVAGATTDKTDEQILAAISGQPPSRRALMRNHGIGQARANRIYETAAARAAKTNTSEQEEAMTRTISETAIEDPQEQGPEDHEANEHDEPRSTEQESHPCITDRVGEARSTEEAPSTHSRGLLHIVGEA